MTWRFCEKKPRSEAEGCERRADSPAGRGRSRANSSKVWQRRLVDRKTCRVVARARDGREAVDLWKRHRPDVTLLDLRMPKLNGVGVIREIRDEDAAARVIVQ